MPDVPPAVSRYKPSQVIAWADSQFNSRLQLEAVLLLGSVLALSSADRGSLSVIAVQLQQTFHISKTAYGALGTVTTGIGALATLPFGHFVDKFKRVRLLGWCVAIWGVAMILSGAAPNYLFLLASRVLLGVITAVAYPAIASLLGDIFMPADRGRAYGWVLSGELIGTGVGILLANFALSLFNSWRAAEFILAIPAIMIAWLVLKMHEPRREAAEISTGENPHLIDNPVYALVSDQNIQPKKSMVLKDDPVSMPFWQSMKYIMKVRTNLVIIVATSLSYFFFFGLEYFALQYAEEHWLLSHTAASELIMTVGVGAVLGIVISGRVTDWWLKRGSLNIRMIIPAVSYAISALILAIGIATHSVAIAVITFFLAAFFFAAAASPLSAARLDIMLPRLWGRAEAARNICQGTFEAFAPITFGLLSDHFFLGSSNALEYTFLVMLVPMLIASAVMLIGLKTYGRDVSTTRTSLKLIVNASAKS